MYLEITVLWARIIEIKSLSLELTFLHFPPIEINFKNWAWISSNSRQLCLSMGRNYRCWIAGGLQARAPVKCLCFPSCLPSKDLHILTHYSVLWSWSAWRPPPPITLMAFKKLKSFEALWPGSWGKTSVCVPLLSPSPAAAAAWGLGCGGVYISDAWRSGSRASPLCRFLFPRFATATSRPLNAAPSMCFLLLSF